MAYLSIINKRKLQSLVIKKMKPLISYLISKNPYLHQISMWIILFIHTFNIKKKKKVKDKISLSALSYHKTISFNYIKANILTIKNILKKLNLKGI